MTKNQLLFFNDITYIYIVAFKIFPYADFYEKDLGDEIVESVKNNKSIRVKILFFLLSISMFTD